MEEKETVQYQAAVLKDGETRSIEALYPDEVPPDSPTRRPGGYVAPGFTQVKHMVPMLSGLHPGETHGAHAESGQRV